MSFSPRRAIALLALSFPLLAEAGLPVEVEVIERSSGRVMPVYWHDGERHVAGEPGCEYEIRLRNHGGGRLLAVTSVDGVNVITGQTASTRGSGYVLDPYGLVEIDGWRKSLDEVAAFYFTRLPDSYAARTGRPDNVGVIGVALFREKVGAYELEEARRSDSAAPPAAGASARAEAAAPAPSADSLTREKSRLGTGHGRRLDSGAVYTAFERASERPAEVIRIYYDSHRNLVARGIIPSPDRVAQRQPDPFPGGFVPDP
jgi:hypothetical protein